ncbi:MAG: hypothetical protein Q8P50_01535 [Bacillota bacterium]|nr:hypothetical protein [Bacillota bacterium]
MKLVGMGKNHGKATFKEYYMGQMSLPMDVGLMIPEKHLVRVVNAAVERIQRIGLMGSRFSAERTADQSR